jgi:hypothetical protein
MHLISGITRRNTLLKLMFTNRFSASRNSEFEDWKVDECIEIEMNGKATSAQKQAQHCWRRSFLMFQCIERMATTGKGGKSAYMVKQNDTFPACSSAVLV